MSSITHIVVKCIEQEDVTGSDTLDFYIDGGLVGTKDFKTGQTSDLRGSVISGDLLINDNSNLTIKERDLIDPSDVLLNHNFNASEISAGQVTLLINPIRPRMNSRYTLRRFDWCRRN